MHFCLFLTYTIYEVKSLVIDLGYWTRVLKKLLITILTIIGLYFVFKLSIFYFPFLIAFIVSIIIEPLIRLVKNHTNLTRRTSAIIVLIIVSVVIIGALSFGAITLVEEASKLLQGLNEHYNTIYNLIQNIMKSFSLEFIPQEVQTIIDNSTTNILSNVSKWIETTMTNILNSLASLPTILTYIGVTLLSIYFICTDKFYILDQIEHHLPRTWAKRIGKHVKELIEVLGGFLKAEVILIFIAFVQVLIGLYIMKFVGFNIQYPLLIAIFIGFIDALPILGSGTVMIPWAIIAAITGDLKLGIAILVLWLIIAVVRQFIEPKIVSKQIGIHPIFTIIAMYTGLRFMGVIGLLVGPIILIILKNIFATLIDKGVFKTIFDKT